LSGHQWEKRSPFHGKEKLGAEGGGNGRAQGGEDMSGGPGEEYDLQRGEAFCRKGISKKKVKNGPLGKRGKVSR